LAFFFGAAGDLNGLFFFRPAAIWSRSWTRPPSPFFLFLLSDGEVSRPSFVIARTNEESGGFFFSADLPCTVDVFFFEASTIFFSPRGSGKEAWLLPFFFLRDFSLGVWRSCFLLFSSRRRGRERLFSFCGGSDEATPRQAPLFSFLITDAFVLRGGSFPFPFFFFFFCPGSDR